MKLQAKRSCPYAYHDGMQGNGGLSPFIPNPDITSTLLLSSRTSLFTRGEGATGKQ
jgi:hypothetical protein